MEEIEESWDLRLFSGTYSVEGSSLVIELFGRTRDDRSITVRCRDFLPYFYLATDDAGVISELREDPEVVQVQPMKLEVRGRMTPCLKVVIKYPWKVPSYRNRYRRDMQVLAADIPFHLRFLYDLDLGSCVRVRGKLEGSERVLERYTTDLVVAAERVETCEDFKPALKVLSFDIENSISSGEIYCICIALRDTTGGEPRHHRISGPEAEIISRFCEIVRDEDPDLITGYNIDGYDIPHILKRAQAQKMGELFLGRNRTPLKSVSDRFWRLAGRVVADAWWNVKREVHPKKETLAAVSRQLLGETKLDVDPRNIDSEWAADPDRVMDYCEKDAELALRIVEKLPTVRKGMELAHVSRLPLDDAINGRTSLFIDSIMIREADRRGLGVPCTHHTGKDDKIEGGYVHEFKPGLYKWIVVLDFKSMYPSIIISNNICFTTLSNEGSIRSPTGIGFVDPKVRRGVLPDILERLMTQRDEAKAKMRSAQSRDERDYYSGLQEALKILMNSVYGVFASSFYRFTDPRIGEAITAFARKNIKSIISELQQEGLEVVYSDTDSIFVKSPEEGLESAVEFGEGLSKRFSKKDVLLEFESVLRSLFSHGAKKRYIASVVHPSEERLVRGYETRRTDSFDYQTEALERLFDAVLEDDQDGAVRLARDSVVALQKGEVPAEKLVISRTVKEEKYYKDPDRMANVQAMKKLQELNYDVVPGMKVSYVVTDSGQVPQVVEPFIDGRSFDHEPDYDYYSQRVAMSLARLTEAFGWDERTLLSGSVQQSLFSGDYDTVPGDEGVKRSPSPKKKKAKPEKKGVSLDDFF